MRLPTIRGTIERRILINYRVDPTVLAALLAAPFEPQLVAGFGVAGICLIRLRNVRPQGAPRWMGISSENAAHRIAVQWQEGGQSRQGVYIPRRDTNSRLNALAGGRVFPGVHHHATFRVHETDSSFQIAVSSDDRKTTLALKADLATAWPGDSVFNSLQNASEFFESGSLGYSPGNRRNQLDGLELRCRDWLAEPLSVREVKSSFFDDDSLFPPGSIALDCALLMRGIEHEWRSRGSLGGSYATTAAGCSSVCNSPIASA